MPGKIDWPKKLNSHCTVNNGIINSSKETSFEKLVIAGLDLIFNF